MSFLQRLGFYSGGLTIGIIILIFFFSGKKSSCDYSPNARVLKNIRIKEQFYSTKSISFLVKNKIDTSSISNLLKTGKVDFGESNTKLDSCKIYTIKSRKKDPVQLILNIKNCDKRATILNVSRLKNP